ncbi:hypothetical protein Q1695_006698 [Nippostrongylus brasiliensis]|nr:hypothetical protein Q1695_006698 [Nippostrongylus brasiliensis]
MATRRRYGTYGRAVTLPAPVLNSSTEWPRPTDMPWNQRAYVAAMTPAAAPPVLPTESPSRRIEARLRQRMINERLRAVHVPATGDDGKSSIQELMNRYLNKSRESLPRGISPPPPPPRPSEPEPGEIRRLVDRWLFYGFIRRLFFEGKCSATGTVHRQLLRHARTTHFHLILMLLRARTPPRSLCLEDLCSSRLLNGIRHHFS